MSEIELLNCPFCGGKAKRIDIEDGENAGGSCICCTVCNASGNLEFGFKENFVDNWNRRRDLSQASVAAALEAAAQMVDTAGDSAVTEALGQSLCCSGYHCGCQGADVGAYLMHHIRALITKPQHDALAAHVAAEVAKARAEDAQAVAYTSSDLIQPASADMSGIDRAMLQSMAASFRGALEFSFNRHDMAELMDRCASRPASADTRTVTVAQLEAWIGAMEDWDEGRAAQKIDEIRAIIGDTE